MCADEVNDKEGENNGIYVHTISVIKFLMERTQRDQTSSEQLKQQWCQGKERSVFSQSPLHKSSKPCRSFRFFKLPPYDNISPRSGCELFIRFSA